MASGTYTRAAPGPKAQPQRRSIRHLDLNIAHEHVAPASFVRRETQGGLVVGLATELELLANQQLGKKGAHHMLR